MTENKNELNIRQKLYINKVYEWYEPMCIIYNDLKILNNDNMIMNFKCSTIPIFQIIPTRNETFIYFTDRENSRAHTFLK